MRQLLGEALGVEAAGPARCEGDVEVEGLRAAGGVAVCVVFTCAGGPGTATLTARVVFGSTEGDAVTANTRLTVATADTADVGGFVGVGDAVATGARGAVATTLHALVIEDRRICCGQGLVCAVNEREVDHEMDVLAAIRPDPNVVAAGLGGDVGQNRVTGGPKEATVVTLHVVVGVVCDGGDVFVMNVEVGVAFNRLHLHHVTTSLCCHIKREIEPRVPIPVRRDHSLSRLSFRESHDVALTRRAVMVGVAVTHPLGVAHAVSIAVGGARRHKVVRHHPASHASDDKRKLLRALGDAVARHEYGDDGSLGGGRVESDGLQVVEMVSCRVCLHGFVLHTHVVTKLVAVHRLIVVLDSEIEVIDQHFAGGFEVKRRVSPRQNNTHRVAL
mmetsp:Transcript_32304/g.75853  ORF Transcript_32304/g.75853 Transcript_32304/m.75853 type:complete len:388 (+) Transcript_32304:507-1670(+)